MAKQGQKSHYFVLCLPQDPAAAHHPMHRHAASFSAGGAASATPASPANPPPSSSFPAGSPSPSAAMYDSMFTWNAYLTAPLRRALGGDSRWTVPLVHGFFEQRRLSSE